MKLLRNINDASVCLIFTCFPRFPERPVGPLLPGEPCSPFGPISPLKKIKGEGYFTLNKQETGVLTETFLYILPSVQASLANQWNPEQIGNRLMRKKWFFLQHKVVTC